VAIRGVLQAIRNLYITVTGSKINFLCLQRLELWSKEGDMVRALAVEIGRKRFTGIG
jgi:hypothetical protein